MKNAFVCVRENFSYAHNPRKKKSRKKGEKEKKRRKRGEKEEKEKGEKERKRGEGVLQFSCHFCHL